MRSVTTAHKNVYIPVPCQVPIVKCYHLHTPTLKHTSSHMYSNGVHTEFAMKNNTVIENTTQKDRYLQLTILRMYGKE
jgi:hypothetical protein